MVHETDRASHADDLNAANSPIAESVPEEDVQAHICQEMASEIRSARPTFQAALSNEIIEYQNELSSTGMLGELLGAGKARRLIKVTITNPESLGPGRSPSERHQRVRDVELSGLDEAEQQLLFSKCAFDLPPSSVW